LQINGVRCGAQICNVAAARPELSLSEYYDSTVAWRDNAMNGVFHGGELVDGRRSRQQTTL
jgi:hypothetical protein